VSFGETELQPLQHKGAPKIDCHFVLPYDNLKERIVDRKIMAGEETAKVSELKEQVWEVADEILATGRYPNRDDICKALKKSSHTIGSYFNEWKKVNPRSALVQQQNSEIGRTKQNSQPNQGRKVINHTVTDEDFQYSAAKTVAAEHYYKKTWNFTVPGLREDLEEALAEIDEHARRQDETLNPLAMVDYLLKRDYPSS
jgi:hypothetical protein